MIYVGLLYVDGIALEYSGVLFFQHVRYVTFLWMKPLH